MTVASPNFGALALRLRALVLLFFRVVGGNFLGNFRAIRLNHSVRDAVSSLIDARQ